MSRLAAWRHSYALVRRASELGISVPELLRREAARIVPPLDERVLGANPSASILARTASDSMALAEALSATLLTRDQRLAEAPGPTCGFEVLGS